MFSYVTLYQTGAFEGQHFRSTGNLVSLSEQQLIDCDRGGQDEGCDGGFEDDALLYIAKNDGRYRFS